MGSIVKAACLKCNYEKEVWIGGGRLDFDSTCLFPCLCRNCHGVVQANLMAPKPECPNCSSSDIIPYDDPELIKPDVNEPITSWNVKNEIGRELLITNGKYYCPICKEFELKFHETGNWD